MKHCRKVLLLWIIVVVIILRSFYSLFAISEKTIKILKESKGERVVDSRGNIHIITMDREEYYGNAVSIDREKNEFITKRVRMPEDDKIFYTYELLDSLGNVIVSRHRLCQTRESFHGSPGDVARAIFPELKPSGPIIIGGSRSGFDQRGMLRILELDKTGNIVKSYFPRAGYSSFDLLWNGKELFLIKVNEYTFMIYKQNGDNFDYKEVNLEDIGIKKIGGVNHWISEDFGSFISKKGSIVVLMRSTDPDDIDKDDREKYYFKDFSIYDKENVRGRDMVNLFILTSEGKIKRKIKKYDIKKFAFKKFSIIEDFGDRTPRLKAKGLSSRIAKRGSIIYAYFRGFDEETEEIELYQLRLTPDGNILKPDSLEIGIINPLKDLPSGLPIYHEYFASYAFDEKGDVYILYKELNN